MIYRRHYAAAVTVTALFMGSNALAIENESTDLDTRQAYLSFDLPVLSSEECIKILGYDKLSQCVKLYSAAHEMAYAQPPQYGTKQQCETLHYPSICNMDSTSKWVPLLRGMQMTLEGTIPISVWNTAQQLAGPDASPQALVTKILQNSPSALTATKSQPLYGDMTISPPRIALLPANNAEEGPTNALSDNTHTAESREASDSDAVTPPVTTPSASNSLHSAVVPALTGAAAAMALQQAGQSASPSPVANPNNDRPSTGTAVWSSPTRSAPTVTPASRQNSSLGNTLRQNSDNIDSQQHAATSALSRGNTGSTTAARQGWGSDSRTATVPTSAAKDAVTERRAANDPKIAPTSSSADTPARNGWSGNKTSGTALDQAPSSSPSKSSSTTAAKLGWGARSSSSSSSNVSRSSSSSVSKSSSSGSSRSLFGGGFSRKKR